MNALLTTPLNQVHRKLGAKMVDFAGYDMPVQYASVLEEHRAVRTGVGTFDVSHMGEIEISGPEALQLVNWVTTNDASKLIDGQAHYSALLYDHGGFVDDILVHRVREDHYFLVVNAANQVKDFAHIKENQRFNAAIENAGPRWAQVAVQGPRAIETMSPLTPVDLNAIRYYHFLDGEFAGVQARLARTGYTGEDGFEIYVAPEDAVHVWNELTDRGAKPCGLGARNTLRMEAAMPLYGNEIHASVNAWEAKLGWIVKLDKGEFVGKQALIKAKDAVTRRLCGFEMTGRGIGRDGYEVLIGGKGAGWVTSGGPSPTLNKNIGLCYLPVEHAEPGRNIEVVVRGQAVSAVTVPTPFYKRSRA